MKAMNLTDEEVIKLVNEYMAARPDALRSQVLTKAAPVGEKRIKALEAAGLIKLPKPLPRAAGNHAWRKSNHRSVLERTS